MSSQIAEIAPETLELLSGNAKRLGLSVDQYVMLLLPHGTEMSLSGDESDFDMDIESLADDIAVSAPQIDYSRSDIYFDHD